MLRTGLTQVSSDPAADTLACLSWIAAPDGQPMQDWPAVVCVNYLAASFFGLQRYPEAEELWLMAQERFDALLAPDDPSRAVTWGNLGRAAIEQSHFADGVERLGRALEITERTQGEGSEQAATYRYYLADAYVRQGELRRGAELHERLVADYERLYGSTSNMTEMALEWLGVVQQKRGRYDRAYDALFRATQIGRRHRPGSLELASSVGKLAELHREMGQYAAAAPLAAEAVELCRARLGDEHPDYAAWLVNESNLLRDMGDHSAARFGYERALAIYEASYGSEHPWVGTALTNLAGLQHQLGDLEGAKPLLQRAVALYEAGLPPDHEFLATGLNNLALVTWGLGDAEAAGPLLKRALDIWERTLGPDHPNSMIGKINLSVLLMDAGKDEEAAELLREEIASAQTRLGFEHPRVAVLQIKLGEALSWTGDLDAALAMYRTAIPVHERALGPDHPDLAWPLTDMARIERLRGDDDGARRTMERVFDLVQRRVLPLMDATSERERIALIRSVRSYVDVYLSIHDRPEDAAAAHRVLLGWKAVVLGSLAIQREQLLATREPELAARIEELAGVRQELAGAVFGAQRGDDDEHLADRIRALTLRKETLERELSRASGAFAHRLRMNTVEPTEVCETLGADEALVDYLRYTPIGRPVYVPELDMMKEPERVESYVAMVLLGGRCETPLRIELGAAEPTDVAIARWRRRVPTTTSGNGLDARSSSIREAAWDPIEAVLGGRTRVRVVPDGGLSGLPFGALKATDGSYLVERYTFGYLGTGSELLRERPRRRARGALVVGGVQYDAGADPAEEPSAVVATRSAPRGQLGSFTFLPHTAEEASEVAERLSALPGGVLRLGARDATEARLREALPGRRIVHLATHGFFATGSVRSALAGRAAPGGGAAATASLEAAIGLNPMLLSGVVFAGVNDERSRRPGSDDGVLTAEEVVSLDLRGTELVTLSACETGLGEVEDGEGVMGLRRAFTLAGSRSLVLSLWKVPDAETRRLMAGFYERVSAKDADPDVALREAQLALIAELRADRGEAPPLFWAAFVVSGR